MALIHVFSYTTLVANADYLMFGAMIALCLRLGLIHAQNIRAIYRTLGYAALLGLVPYIYIDQLSMTSFWPGAIRDGYARFVPVLFFTSFVIYAVAQNQGKPLRGPVTRLFAFLGYLSYGLYLVHPLIFRLYDQWTAGTYLGQARTKFFALILRAILGGGISILIAYFSRRFFEERFLQLKNRLTPSLSRQEAGALDQTPV
jgi:peptidoglycan/LPS O-acetylase OafA/YrhL